jgi:predicted nucleic acid-binding Zn ribbon protein
MALDSLFSVIQKVRAKNPSFSARLSEAAALGRWEVAVGALIAKQTRALKVQDAVLWVEVTHPIWRAELHYRKRQILEILNGQISSSLKDGIANPHAPLTDIFFVSSSHETPVRKLGWGKK